MEQNDLVSVSTVSVTKDLNLSRIDDDIILFDDFANLPVPGRPSRNLGLIVGMCLQGSYKYTADTEVYHVHAGEVHIIHEGQVVDNFRPSDDVRGIGIMMSYDFFHEIVKGIHELSSLFLFSRSHPVFKLQANEIEDAVDYFKLVKKKIDESGKHFRKDVVRMLISAMVYDLSNAIYRIQMGNDKKQTRAEAIFTTFIRLVEQNYRTERRVGWYAHQMCITAKYLSETVKQVSKRTPNDWIDNYVVMELRVQLKNTTKSIKEIAQDMCFPNQSFMGKYFKEHVGMSPMSYRKS
ncbi:transcriptional regulator [Prevotella sp. CAG:1185]|nr:transcriptional regulator [Prevotella sp. CAG:1185]